jgi:hypothetical protein
MAMGKNFFYQNFPEFSEKFFLLGIKVFVSGFKPSKEN